VNLNRALTILAKFFAVNGDVFTHSLSKATIIAWAQQIKDSSDKELGDLYQLTQPQHAFLIGEILSFSG